jgi:hypothetical protein
MPRQRALNNYEQVAHKSLSKVFSKLSVVGGNGMYYDQVALNDDKVISTRYILTTWISLTISLNTDWFRINYLCFFQQKLINYIKHMKEIIVNLYN